VVGGEPDDEAKVRASGSERETEQVRTSENFSRSEREKLRVSRSERNFEQPMFFIYFTIHTKTCHKGTKQ